MSSMKSNKKQNLSIFKAIRRVVPLTIKAIPFTCLVFMFIVILHGIAWGLIAPINQRLYDALADLALGHGYLRQVYIGAAMVTLVMIFQQVMNALHNLFDNDLMFHKASGRLAQVIHAKVKKLPAQVFEDKDRLDDIEKANEGKNGAFWTYMTIHDMIFFYGTYYAVMGVFLWRMQPVLVLAIAFIFAPSLLAQVVEARIHARLEEISAPIRRQNAHYEDSLIGLRNMKETRLFGAYRFFKKLYMDSLALLANKEWDAQKRIQLMYFGVNFAKAAGWVGVLVLLFRSLVHGNISVGAFAAVFGSVQAMFWMMEEALWRIRASFGNDLGKVHNFINLLDIPTPEKSITEPNFIQGITAANLVFAYPKAEKNAIDGVSITMHPGETLALVGENGSGKTTLVKLLCGLYKPNSGKIEIGGQDVSATADSALFAKTSGVFQNYGQYAFSLKENVQISASSASHGPIPAMVDADVDYQDTKTFPNGIDTVLSREYEGVDLSGGQWQRIATARGLYRYHDFIVLDEPTAAIDPIEETRIYKRFAELTQDKMAVLVTHRLGSARIADRIAVMDGGKIVEIGNHEDLLAANGKYAQMWAAQAENYSF